MARVFLLHWNRAEAEERAALLRRDGHRVSVHWSAEEGPDLATSLPDIAVISLDRLPSHGRAVAEWLWEAKKRQHIPIVFAGGEPDKVAVTRNKFPRAVFCPTSEIGQTVAGLRKPRPGATRVAEESARRDTAKPKKRPGTAAQSARRRAPKRGATSRPGSRAARG